MSRVEELCRDAEVPVHQLHRRSRTESVDTVRSESDGLTEMPAANDVPAGPATPVVKGMETPVLAMGLPSVVKGMETPVLAMGLPSVVKGMETPVLAMGLPPVVKGMETPVLAMRLPSGLLTPGYTPRQGDCRSRHASLMEEGQGNTAANRDTRAHQPAEVTQEEKCPVHGGVQPLWTDDKLEMESKPPARRHSVAVMPEGKLLSADTGHVSGKSHQRHTSESSATDVLGRGAIGTAKTGATGTSGRGATGTAWRGAAGTAGRGATGTAGREATGTAGRGAAGSKLNPDSVGAVRIAPPTGILSRERIGENSAPSEVMLSSCRVPPVGSTTLSRRDVCESSSQPVPAPRPSPRCAAVAPRLPASRPQGAAMVTSRTVEQVVRRTSPRKKAFLSQQSSGGQREPASSLHTASVAAPPPSTGQHHTEDMLQCAHGRPSHRCKVCPQPRLNPAVPKVLAAGVQKLTGQKAKTIFKSRGRHAVMSMCVARGKVTIHKMGEEPQVAGKKKRHTRSVLKPVLSEPGPSQSQPYDFSNSTSPSDISCSQPEPLFRASVTKTLFSQSQRSRPLPSGSPEFQPLLSSAVEHLGQTSSQPSASPPSSGVSSSVLQRSPLPGRRHPSSTARTQLPAARRSSRHSSSVSADESSSLVKQEPSSPVQMKRKRTIPSK